MKQRRIGVYGGTFDPVHNGHLLVARAILEAFELEQMLFVPAFVPPHKRGRVISSPLHRWTMLALATMNEPQFQLSTIELEAPERPYTIETLGRLKAQLNDARLFFVMGEDSFRDVMMWREHERLLTEYDCVVAVRPEPQAATDAAKPLSAHLSSRLQARVVDLRGGARPTNKMLQAPRVYLTDYVATPVSSTEIRAQAAASHSVAPMVPAPVADYIAKYRLYQGS